MTRITHPYYAMIANEFSYAVEEEGKCQAKHYQGEYHENYDDAC